MCVSQSRSVRANIFAMQREENFNGESYDVGTGSNISLNEIKKIIQTHFPDVKFEYIEERKGDVMHTCADISKMKSLGWTTNTEIRQGINNCFERLKGEK